jgi:hypothetical protein
MTEQSRADRNNNPTAFTTDVAEEAGLVRGKDFNIGDPFQIGNEIYYTAHLLAQNPVPVTISVIDKITFNTKKGMTRWSYINILPSLWNSLIYYEKRFIVAIMYHFEGGSKLDKYFSGN